MTGWSVAASHAWPMLALLAIPLFAAVAAFARPEWRAHPGQMRRDLLLVTGFWLTLWLLFSAILVLRSGSNAPVDAVAPTSAPTP